MRLEDISARRFGRLLVLERVPRGTRGAWLCECDCGKLCFAQSADLKLDKMKSCGCWRKESATVRASSHLMTDTKEYRAWSNMIQRCTNPNNNRYSDWGGRGISVCERWLTFENFFADMGVAPDGMSLDRINNDGNYEPANCRWATRSEQRRNQRPRCV